jgi:hypothetical protein
VVGRSGRHGVTEVLLEAAAVGELAQPWGRMVVEPACWCDAPDSTLYSPQLSPARPSSRLVVGCCLRFNEKMPVAALARAWVGSSRRRDLNTAGGRLQAERAGSVRTE